MLFILKETLEIVYKTTLHKPENIKTISSASCNQQKKHSGISNPSLSVKNILCENIYAVLSSQQSKSKKKVNS